MICDITRYAVGASDGTIYKTKQRCHYVLPINYHNSDGFHLSRDGDLNNLFYTIIKYA